MEQESSHALQACKIIQRIVLDGVFPQMGCCTAEIEVCNPVLVMDITLHQAEGPITAQISLH